MKALLRKIRQLLRSKKIRKIWHRGVSTFAAIVVFVTTYALVLPAITLEATAVCGILEHQHDDSCYEEVLTCGLEESDGHQHEDSCYTTVRDLVCDIPEHTHSAENECYDAEGNLVCSKAGHTHEEGCYKETRELTCGLEESAGHHHGDQCYEKVLTCGREYHVHSAACYRNDAANTAETAMAAASTNESAAIAVSTSESAAAAASTGSAAAEGESTDTVNSGSASTGATVDIGFADDSYDYGHRDDGNRDDDGKTDASASATTNVLPEELEESAAEELSEGYVPALDPVDMGSVLTRHTGFYYFDASEYAADHPEGDMPENSGEIQTWQEYTDDVELEEADMLRLYLTYKVPAGSLNETNQVSRYHLPSNLHLTDDQIMAINETVNGAADSYVDMSTLEITDEDKYEFYRGAEAVEGDRTPDQDVNDYLYGLVKDGKEGQEYISAVVKAENVFDQSGEYVGQDLIFIWTPYSIEKNQNEYDKDGQPTKAGEKISGWFSVDFNTAQVEWESGLNSGDGNDEAEGKKTAEIVLVNEDKSAVIKEISETLTMVDASVDDQTVDDPKEDDQKEDASKGITEDTEADVTVDDRNEDASKGTTEDAEADVAVEDHNEDVEQSSTGETAEAAEPADTADTAEEEAKYAAGTLTTTGESYTITLDYTAEAEIPEDAQLKVTEITEESDPEAYKSCLETAKAQVAADDGDDAGKTTVDELATRFFDIEIQTTAVDEDGKVKTEKVEPKAAVSVNIQLIETPETVAGMAEDGAKSQSARQGAASDPTVLHFAEGGVETLESTTGAVSSAVEDSKQGDAADDAAAVDNDTQQGEGTAIQFETSSFSIYGVVYTSVITTTYISASGESYEITVTYDNDAGIPEGSDLVVREIEEGTEEYIDYLQNSASKLGLVSGDVQFARFFDIEIQKAYTDGTVEKIEPKTPVKVQIRYVDPVDISEDASLNVIHFAEMESGVATEVITDIEVSEDGKKISYIQNSFSVTGTIGGTPNNGEQKMILIHDTYQGQDRYYIVNNDATLTEVWYDSATNTVSVIEPMLWTFEGSGNNRHIYFNSEATGFGTNQVASDYYRRYLDPTASTDTHNGYTEENKDVSVSLGDYNPAQWWNQDTGTYVSNNYVSNRNNALSETALTYDEGSHAIHQGNTYFTIERDAGGKPVRLVGQDGSAGAAYFEFATASKVPNGFHLDNAVNHIDISIKGSAKVNIPLAYGSYYGPNGAASPAIKVVKDNEKLELGEAQMLDPTQLGVTAEDMKRATISASSPNSSDLNEAFYITGFSQNTGTAYSTPQIRIEGKFLVADVPADQNYNGYSLRNVEGNLYDGQGWWGFGRDWNYVNAVRAARLANKVTYTVTVIKPLQYYLTDPELGKLYDSEGNPIIVTVDVAFSASFNYWDDENSANGGNECPPIQGNSDWKAGDIPNHDLSGMDFKLGGDADDPNSPLLAIEITKVIQDENGNRIALKTPVTNTFEIHQSKTAKRNGVKDIDVDEYKGQISEDIYQGYSPLHDKSITVGSEGMALVYDYNVSDGMYYIVEKSDPDNLPRTVTDTNDNVWDYVDTYIETEYVRRGDQYDDKDEYPNPMHVSKKFTTDDSEYKSVPEVLGKFTTLTGEEKKSGFLEFFVYNIYKPKKTELTFNKVWADALTDGSGKYIIIGGTRYNLSDLRIEVELQRYTNNNTTPDDWTSVADSLPENVRKQTLDGTADSVPAGTDAMGYETADWSCIWKNLPSGNGGNVYTYSAKEVSVKTADGTELTDKFLQITDKTGSNGVTVTNTLNNTNVTLEKQWDPVPDGNWSATFQIQRSRRQITDAQGNSVTNQPWSDWEQARTEAGADGTDVPNQIINQDTTDAKVTIENLPKYFKDTDGTIWEYKYRGLETDFQTNSQETYDRGLTQEGDAAHGYNIIATNKLSETTNVIAKKQWQSSADSSNNNDSGSGNSGTGSGDTGNSGSGSNNEDSIIADPNVTAIEFTLYELITDNNRPEGSVKIGAKWYKVAADADGHAVLNNPQKVSRGGSDKWTGEEQATWTNLSRGKTYYVMETGTYYKNGGSELYLNSAPNYASGGEVTLENGQRTATIFNKPLTLQLSKKWSGLVTGEEWPEGYTVEYTITREYSYKNGANTISGTDDGFSFVVTKDNENAQYLLSGAQKTVDFTGIFPAYGIKDGNVAAYTYFVTETKVNTPDDTSYTFKTGERKVFLQDGSAVGLLKADINNQLTSVSVQKRWSGNHANDQATVTLYKYVDTGQSVTKVITVKVAEDNEVVGGQPTGKSKENLGDRIVYVVMDGDEATKQNLTKDGEVTFSVADDAEHYFTYSLSDTDDGRLTVTGPGHAHAGEAIKVAVQDNTQYLKTITVNLTFTNNNPDQDKFTSSDYIDVQINGQTKRLTRDNRTTSFQVLGAGTFPVSYTTSRPDYLGVIDADTNSLAQNRVVVGNDVAVINLKPVESQPTKIGFQGADLHKWTDNDYVTVVIDDGDNGSFTFKKGDSGTVRSLNLGNSGTHTLSYICGGDAVVTNGPTSIEATHEVTIYATSIPGANAKKVPITFTVSEDASLTNVGNWGVGLSQFYAVEDQNNSNYKLGDSNNGYLSPSNRSISSTNVPNTLSYKVNTRLNNQTQPPISLDFTVNGVGCTAIKNNDSITITNITSDTPTVQIHVRNLSRARNNTDLKQATSFFAQLLGAPIEVYAAGTTRTSFSAGNGLTVTGIDDLPNGAVAIDTFTGTGTEWSHTWKDLPVVDENGRTIHYYVVETGAATTGNYEEVQASHTVEINADGSYSVVIENTTTGEEPQTGAIQITKAVTVNDAAPTDSNKAKTNGIYEFTVAGIADTATAGISHTVKITFADGKATKYQIDTNAEETVTGTDNTWSVVLGDLTAGQYTVAETAHVNGMVLKTVTGTSVNEGTKVATVTVTAGEATPSQAAQVSFINNYTEYEVIIVKEDTTAPASKLNGAVFDLYEESQVNQNGTLKPDAVVKTSGLTTAGTGDEKGKVSLGMLTTGKYYLFETTAPGGYEQLTEPVEVIVADGTVSLKQGGSLRTGTITQGKTELEVFNNPGVELPSTGGPGTRMIYLLGGMLTMAGLLLLHRRKRIET